MACALPELSHPGIQLLLVPHLKDDICPVLHLARKKGVLYGCLGCAGVTPGGKSCHSPSGQRYRGCLASRGVCIAGPPGYWSRLLVAWALNSRRPRWGMRLVPDGPSPTQASVFLQSPQGLSWVRVQGSAKGAPRPGTRSSTLACQGPCCSL